MRQRPVLCMIFYWEGTVHIHLGQFSDMTQDSSQDISTVSHPIHTDGTVNKITDSVVVKTEGEENRKDDVLKIPESKLVKSSSPQTPKEKCHTRQVNIELSNDSNCSMSKSPMGVGYEVAQRLKARHHTHTRNLKKRKLFDDNKNNDEVSNTNKNSSDEESNSDKKGIKTT